MLFPFTNSKVGISAFDIYCGQDLFSITARYPDWVNEMMGEALWREICLIVNKPKHNVKLKSVTGQVHCKRKKCCTYEPFTPDSIESKEIIRIPVNHHYVIASFLDIKTFSSHSLMDCAVKQCIQHAYCRSSVEVVK